MNLKNSLLSGFQDFLPRRMLQRNVLIATTRDCFEKFGFLPQDTPCLEYTELLMGKYGEGEKLIYSFHDHGDRNISLRYDLTVPLYRIIKTYADEIVFPYRRYQIGLVWRADRPGKGRYREFMQMDADIIDDNSALADTEMLLLANHLTKVLDVKAIIQFNSRPILDALVETCGLDQSAGVNLIRIIDKFNKIGLLGVISELNDAGFSSSVIDIINRYLKLGGSNNAVLQGLTTILGNSLAFRQGFDSLSKIVSTIEQSEGDVDNFRINPTIARGLNYYTGVIFETMLVDNPGFGSICSGGRYDHLIVHPDGRFLPSIGLSIGIDRLFAAMESVNKAPLIETTTQVFIVNFGENFIAEYLKLANELRHAGLAVEIFSKSAKIAKQLKVASNKNIPLVLLVGPDEISRSQVFLKDMRTGTQINIGRNDVLQSILKCLAEHNIDASKEV